MSCVKLSGWDGVYDVEWVGWDGVYDVEWVGWCVQC